MNQNHYLAILIISAAMMLLGTHTASASFSQTCTSASSVILDGIKDDPQPPNTNGNVNGRSYSGFRLNKGVRNLTVTSCDGSTYCVSNNWTNDLFVPLHTDGEWTAFYNTVNNSDSPLYGKILAVSGSCSGSPVPPPPAVPPTQNSAPPRYRLIE